jgi:hypothetical protein
MNSRINYYMKYSNYFCSNSSNFFVGGLFVEESVHYKNEHLSWLACSKATQVLLTTELPFRQSSISNIPPDFNS